MGFGAVVSDDD